MDLSRLEGVMDIERLSQAVVGIVGVGGASDLAQNMVRCGVEHLRLIDRDVVGRENIARQGHDAAAVGAPKVKALSKKLKAINADVDVRYLAADFLELGDDEIEDFLGGADLLIVATDAFRAQAKGNAVALKYGIPALFPGLYRGGEAGEVIFWHPGIDACYQCLCKRRYEAHEAAEAEGRSLDPGSDGATIYDIALLDAVAGQLAMGLLTRGADNRFGRLIDLLGDRNFLQVKIDPLYRLRGRDVVRESLGVSDDCASFTGWTTIALANETCDVCTDCERYRGHRFRQMPGGILVRWKPGDPEPQQEEETVLAPSER
jgi:molybdopterin/thiamine biosynthesis adenylyltransferase